MTACDKKFKTMKADTPPISLEISPEMGRNVNHHDIRYGMCHVALKSFAKREILENEKHPLTRYLEVYGHVQKKVKSRARSIDSRADLLSAFNQHILQDKSPSKETPTGESIGQNRLDDIRGVFLDQMFLNLCNLVFLLGFFKPKELSESFYDRRTAICPRVL